MSEVHELLTIDETARVMGVSKNTVYANAKRYLATNGEEGLEVVDACGQMRVPRRRLEEKLKITIDHIPPPRVRKAQVEPEPQSETSTSAPASAPPDATRDSADRARSPVGYIGRVVAQWRLKR